jgi:hypothetical protein
MTSDPDELRYPLAGIGEMRSSRSSNRARIRVFLLHRRSGSLYSTYILLLAIRARVPGIDVVTVPGVTAFSAAAALAEFAVGEAKDPVSGVGPNDGRSDGGEASP